MTASTGQKDAYLAIQVMKNNKNNDGTTTMNNLLEVTTKAVLRRTAKREDLHVPTAGMQLLESVPRYTKKGLKGEFLHFGDRPAIMSKKNHQLQDKTTKEKVFQIGKKVDNEFFVDYKDPLNAFQAFGFAWAQFEASAYRL